MNLEFFSGAFLEQKSLYGCAEGGDPFFLHRTFGR
jgi:hypothetical protein